MESASLPVASFSKFEPQSPEFLDITNPKAMLENALRSFACLTSGDVIAIRYNNKVYELRVLETKPGPAVSIIECDMDVGDKYWKDFWQLLGMFLWNWIFTRWNLLLQSDTKNRNGHRRKRKSKNMKTGRKCCLRRRILYLSEEVGTG